MHFGFINALYPLDTRYNYCYQWCIKKIGSILNANHTQCNTPNGSTRRWCPLHHLSVSASWYIHFSSTACNQLQTYHLCLIIWIVIICSFLSPIEFHYEFEYMWRCHTVNNRLEREITQLPSIQYKSQKVECKVKIINMYMYICLLHLH